MDLRGSTYWCHRCDRFIRVYTQHIAICPDCCSGFIEGITNSPLSSLSPISPNTLLTPPNPSTAYSRFTLNTQTNSSSFNPVIALPRSPNFTGTNFQLYYDDGSGFGLLPLSISMSELLMGSGFDRIIHQFGRFEIDVIENSLDNSPASKLAVECMPVIKIVANHIISESHCAVCTEQFEIDTDAREMPCKHFYHSDCILPWLLLHNSCPICRYKLPTDENRNESENVEGRLPGGGFVVGRGGIIDGEYPVLYTEIDENGGFRRISWPLRGRRSIRRRGFVGAFRNFFSIFRRRVRNSSSSSSVEIRSPPSTFGRRRGEEWTFGV